MILTGSLRYFKKTVSQYHLGHCKSHVGCPDAEPELPQQEGGNWSLKCGMAFLLFGMTCVRFIKYCAEYFKCHHLILRYNLLSIIKRDIVSNMARTTLLQYI